MTSSPSTARQVLWAVGFAAIGIVIVLLVVTIFEIRQTQVNNSPVLKAVNRSTHTIKDCTQPTGKCFKRGQQQTANAVDSINKITVVAAACAAEPGLPYLTVPERVSRIQACIVKELHRK